MLKPLITAAAMAIGLLSSASLLAQDAPPPAEAKINVYKVYAGFVAVEDPDILDVEIELRCTGGADLVQPALLKVENGVEFTHTGFTEGETDCEVIETAGRDDYFPVYQAETGDNPPPPPPNAGLEILDEFENYPFEDAPTACRFDDITSGEYTCIIYNIPEAAEYTVNKTWEIAGSDDTGGIDSQYEIQLICLGGFQYSETADEVFNEGFGFIPISGAVWYGYDTEDAEFVSTVVPLLHIEGNIEGEYRRVGAGCFVMEETYDSRVEMSTDCPYPPEGDDINDFFEYLLFGTETSVLPGTSQECEVVNTLFFEGIPTLNQFGMAVMALLMLGVGFVSMRRIV